MPLTQLPLKATACPAMSQYQSRAVSIAMYLFHGYLYDKGQSHPLPKCCHCLKKKKKKKLSRKRKLGEFKVSNSAGSQRLTNVYPATPWASSDARGRPETPTSQPRSSRERDGAGACSCRTQWGSQQGRPWYFDARFRRTESERSKEPTSLAQSTVGLATLASSVPIRVTGRDCRVRVWKRVPAPVMGGSPRWPP